MFDELNEKPSEEMDNYHARENRKIEVSGKARNFEYIHQQRSGDCVLVNFLNTWSFLHDGRLPMTVNEARYGAINLRKDEDIEQKSIRKISSGLTQEDAALLFSQINGVDPNWEEDVLSVEGRLNVIQRRLKAVDVLEYLATYSTGVCVTGLREHCRSIIKLEGDNYAYLDPFNADGVSFHDTKQLVSIVASLMKNRPADSNFFFFLRG